VELRQRYPDWGARKLQVLLARAEWSCRPAHPSHFVAASLVRSWDRHETALQRFERAQPNQLWQMDFKGSKDGRPVGPLSLLDDHSRYLIALRGTDDEGGSGAGTTGVGLYGMRRAGSHAHGSRHSVVECESPTGATWLTVWLMQQGIQLHWSGYRHPQTRARWNAFTVRCSARNYGAACPTSNASSGWMSIATNITRCGRMKRWKCRLREPVATERARL